MAFAFSCIFRSLEVIRFKASMQREFTSAVILVGIILLLSFQTAYAWSSRASYTDNDIRVLAVAIKHYRMDVGKLPASEQYWVELQRGGWEASSKQGPPSDRWGRPIVYRTPGKHGEFDLYSYGQNGVDDDGKLDDISSWAGVNDGFYWKATWPRGRFAILLGAMLGFGCLLFARLYPWRLVAPLAGSFVCLGVLLGCHWLMHPGIVPSRNGPLALSRFVSVVVLAGFIVCFIVNLRKRGLTMRWS